MVHEPGLFQAASLRTRYVVFDIKRFCGSPGGDSPGSPDQAPPGGGAGCYSGLHAAAAEVRRT